MKLQIRDDDLLDANTLYRFEESRANQFNLKCLLVLGVFSILCEILNNLGVFVVSKHIMHICSAAGLLAFVFPVVIWFIHDRILERENSVTEWSGFKYLILVSIYAGVAIYSVMLTFHAIILLALPPVFAAQYSDQKRLLLWTLLGGILVVPIGVFGGYFIGLTDRNFYDISELSKSMLTPQQRLSIATKEDLIKLLVYFVMPRLFFVITINILVSGIARRNGSMLSRQAALADQIHTDMERRNDTLNHVIEDLATLIETRDLKSVEHVAQTRQYVGDLARVLKEDASYKEELSDRDILEMESAAPLHDIGKIAISDTILLKPGKLTPEEFEVIKTHTVKGGEMVRRIFSDPDHRHLIQMAEEIVVYHHEKWDGTGYPKGLKGAEIPLPARIMAIADVYDALISERPYKKAMSREDALKVIYSGSGMHFDPEIIRVMRRHEDHIF